MVQWYAGVTWVVVVIAQLYRTKGLGILCLENSVQQKMAADSHGDYQVQSWMVGIYIQVFQNIRQCLWLVIQIGW